MATLITDHIINTVSKSLVSGFARHNADQVSLSNEKPGEIKGAVSNGVAAPRKRLSQDAITKVKNAIHRVLRWNGRDSII